MIRGSRSCCRKSACLFRYVLGVAVALERLQGNLVQANWSRRFIPKTIERDGVVGWARLDSRRLLTEQGMWSCPCQERSHFRRSSRRNISAARCRARQDISRASRDRGRGGKALRHSSRSCRGLSDHRSTRASRVLSSRGLCRRSIQIPSAILPLRSNRTKAATVRSEKDGHVSASMNQAQRRKITSSPNGDR
jgi:hypothetical protein